jgi:hypothetical protein
VKCIQSLVFAAVFAASSPALAEQTGYDIEKGSQEWRVHARWTDAAGASHSARFALPTALVKQDLETPLKFKKGEASKAQAAAINDYGETLGGVKLEAKSSGGAVSWSASGENKTKMKEAMEEAGHIADASLQAYLDDKGYTEIDGAILPDHARHVDEYAPELAGVVSALGGPTGDPRDFAAAALAFVQNIPYEKRALISDLYRRPLSLLGRNKGDCDSKTVLFLAMMRQAYPDLPLAVVYIPGHAFGAIGVDEAGGDRTVVVDSQRFVAVEPVGPALQEVGELTGKSKRRARWGRYTIQVAG